MTIAPGTEAAESEAEETRSAERFRSELAFPACCLSLLPFRQLKLSAFGFLVVAT